MEPKTLSLTAYVGRRTLATIPLVAGVIILTFVLIHVAPGDPVAILAGEYTTPEHQAFIRQQFGLDRPPLQRFWFYVTRAVRGDLGFSYASGRPVIAEIGARIPPTVLLVVSALGFSAISGVVLGVVAARRPTAMLPGGESALVLPPPFLAPVSGAVS
jgi:peptide/nickel transport system permease protein